MTFLDLLWLPLLMVPIAMVVGAAGRPPREVLPGIRRTFVTLLVGVVLVSLVVRGIVVLVS